MSINLKNSFLLPLSTILIQNFSAIQKASDTGIKDQKAFAFLDTTARHSLQIPHCCNTFPLTLNYFTDRVIHFSGNILPQ